MSSPATYPIINSQIVETPEPGVVTSYLPTGSAAKIHHAVGGRLYFLRTKVKRVPSPNSDSAYRDAYSLAVDMWMSADGGTTWAAQDESGAPFYLPNLGSWTAGGAYNTTSTIQANPGGPSPTWTLNQLRGLTLTITAGTGVGTSFFIIANTETSFAAPAVITIDGTFGFTPDGTTVFQISQPAQDQRGGSAFWFIPRFGTPDIGPFSADGFFDTSSTVQTDTVPSPAWTVNEFSGRVIRLFDAGNNVIDQQTIIGNTPTGQVTDFGPYLIDLDHTRGYAGFTQLAIIGASFAENQVAGYKLHITAGTGMGFEGVIASNTSSAGGQTILMVEPDLPVIDVTTQVTVDHQSQGVVFIGGSWAGFIPDATMTFTISGEVATTHWLSPTMAPDPNGVILWVACPSPGERGRLRFVAFNTGTNTWGASVGFDENLSPPWFTDILNSEYDQIVNLTNLHVFRDATRFVCTFGTNLDPSTQAVLFQVITVVQRFLLASTWQARSLIRQAVDCYTMPMGIVPRATGGDFCILMWESSLANQNAYDIYVHLGGAGLHGISSSSPFNRPVMAIGAVGGVEKLMVVFGRNITPLALEVDRPHGDMNLGYCLIDFVGTPTAAELTFLSTPSYFEATIEIGIIPAIGALVYKDQRFYLAWATWGDSSNPNSMSIVGRMWQSGSWRGRNGATSLNVNLATGARTKPVGSGESSVFLSQYGQFGRIQMIDAGTLGFSIVYAGSVDNEDPDLQTNMLRHVLIFPFGAS